MIHISKFKSFNEEVEINNIIKYIDQSINESFDIGKIWNNVINKIKNFSTSGKKKIIKYAILSMLATNTISGITSIINNSNAKVEDKKIAIEVCDEIKEEKYKLGYEWRLSSAGLEHIKNEEKCVLKAYKIGDGKVTVGYGHAEDIESSKIKVGSIISKNLAEKYLKKDLKIAADGVRRMFKDWSKEGKDVSITQNMFDALVSMAYNAGVGGLRRSEVVKYLKNNDYESAGDSIKKFRVSKKFPGLASRREKESKMFLSSI